MGVAEGVGLEGGNGGGGKEEEEEETGLLEGVGAVLDFDMLCATVAMQTQGFSAERRGKGGMVVVEGGEEEAVEVGGVQRMWEGGVLDCFQDHRIAVETTCLPCYRFGKNMGRANLGSCFLQARHIKINCIPLYLLYLFRIFTLPFIEQVAGFFVKSWMILHFKAWVGKLLGAIYFFLTVTILFNVIAFGISMRRCFLYLAVGLMTTAAIYLGYFRGRIRKQFNIRGSNSSLDDCMNHLLCPCCTLCQESRTLEMNNVQDGVWRGRGDTICIGSFGEGSKMFSELCPPSLVPTKSPELCNMERAANIVQHSWNAEASHSTPLVPAA